MSRPRRAIRRLASAARLSPPVSSACIRAREAAVSAVSAPAKNAAATRPHDDDEDGERDIHARQFRGSGRSESNCAPFPLGRIYGDTR